MAYNLYRCQHCAYETRALTSAKAFVRPHCPSHYVEAGMAWVPDGAPHVGALGWKVDIGEDEPFIVNTIQDANRLERESRERGDPVVLRAMHREPSNMDAPVLRGVQQAPDPTDPRTRERIHAAMLARGREVAAGGGSLDQVAAAVGAIPLPE